MPNRKTGLNTKGGVGADYAQLAAGCVRLSSLATIQTRAPRYLAVKQVSCYQYSASVPAGMSFSRLSGVRAYFVTAIHLRGSCLVIWNSLN